MNARTYMKKIKREYYTLRSPKGNKTNRYDNDPRQQKDSNNL